MINPRKMNAGVIFQISPFIKAYHNHVHSVRTIKKNDNARRGEENESVGDRNLSSSSSGLAFSYP